MMELSEAQSATVLTVYTSALLPLFIVMFLRFAGRLPEWFFQLYLATFVLCAVGWEIWLTYGIVDGLDVASRRPAVMNEAIPVHVNWLLNSLADAGAIGLVGALLAKWLCGGWEGAFRRWRWSVFGVLLVWFVGQNLWVELTIYQAQLAHDYRLSWAPLIPTGPWFNPVVELGGKTVQLQTQLPWLLATPLFYALAIRLYNRGE